jgi:hypothetical protein
MTAFRNSASFGKRQEYMAVAELLRRGFDVYMTLVDDQQIDCIIRHDTTPPTYTDVQIKARSAGIANPGYFPLLSVKQPRKNFCFVFYDESMATYWVIPSLDIVAEGNELKSGDNKGKYSLKLINKTSKNKRPKFQKYENNFDLLKEAHA